MDGLKRRESKLECMDVTLTINSHMPCIVTADYVVHVIIGHVPVDY